MGPSNDDELTSTFRGSKFFKVLGRIDEESSFRASLSNITSQDSSPRSDEGEHEVNDWLTPIRHGTNSNNYKREQMSPPATLNSMSNTSNIKKNINSNQNITVVTTVTTVEDPKMDAASSTERRQDRSSPIPLKSQTPSPSPYDSLPSQMHSTSSGSSRDQHGWHQHQQHHAPKSQDEDQIRRENKALQRECDELESIILQMKTEGNTLQVRTALKLKKYRAQIEKATEEKERLQTQCSELEDKILRIRTETHLKQESIWATEEKLRKQKQQQR